VCKALSSNSSTEKKGREGGREREGERRRAKERKKEKNYKSRN
jgi:hypothetical protein